MVCEICGSSQCKVIYNGRLRKGSFGHQTEREFPMYCCEGCGCIWHEQLEETSGSYYTSEQYRNDIDETGAEDYYSRHDFEVLEKLEYTGTGMFRNKVAADIGCGCGSFLDFVKGASAGTIAIEPTSMFHSELQRKGHKVYSYMPQAMEEYEGKVDIITSFDVIEHVESPVEFMTQQRKLLKKGGIVINGTPSSAVVMRSALGREYEEFLYSCQHPWIFSEDALKKIAEQAGFKKVRVEYRQRYGLGNLLSWLTNHRPMGQITYDYISSTTEDVWKRELEKNKMADYLVLYAELE